MIQTVNVIELTGGCIMNLVSFEESLEGNKQAEELFIKIVSDNYPDRVEFFEIEKYIENGIFEHDDYEVVIFHSTSFIQMEK